MNKFKKRRNALAKITGVFAGIFALLLVVSPAFAANVDHSNTLALSIILPALALCSAIIFGVWHQITRTKLIRVRSARR